MHMHVIFQNLFVLSCYRSRTQGQGLLCFQLRTDEAYVQYNGK